MRPGMGEPADGADRPVVAAPSQAWSSRSGAVLAAPVGAIVLLVTGSLLVFRGYLSGAATPPWDFYSNYLTGAHSWWDLGSFFNPPQFIPYIVGGYPAYLGIQGSGWYLPVGLVAGLFDYTPHAAAALQAASVAFGSVGAYLLSGELGLRRSCAVVVGCGFLFTAGFFSNAQHVDILRAWALLPWLLLALTRPRTKSPWAVALAAMLWFQFFVGAYPGSIVAAAYLCGGWALITFWLNPGRRLNYAAWLLATVGVGILLAMPKWLPYVLGSGSQYQPGSDLVFNLGSVATIFFPYTSEVLANDVSMRSFFVVPVLTLAAFFAGRNRRLIRYALFLIIAGAVLGLPVGPLLVIQRVMPLLDLSRFGATDFKVGMVLGVVLLGASGLQMIVEAGPGSRSAHWWRARLAIATWAVLFVCLAGFAVGLPSAALGMGLLWVVASVLALVAVRLVVLRDPAREGTGGSPEEVRAVVAIGFVFLLVAVIGMSWANTAKYVWSVPRVHEEYRLWGRSADELIAGRGDLVLERRPARLGPALPMPEGSVGADARWNGSDYSRIPAMAGYMNLKGIPLFEEYVSLSSDPAGVDTMALLQRESTAWLLPPDQDPSPESGACALAAECTSSEVRVVRWQPGVIEVGIPQGTGGRVAINELAYPGWTATLCGRGSCEPAADGPSPGDFFLSAGVDERAESVLFTYQTPYERASWLLFGAGVLGLLAAVSLPVVRRSRALVDAAGRPASR